MSESKDLGETVDILEEDLSGPAEEGEEFRPEDTDLDTSDEIFARVLAVLEDCITGAGFNAAIVSFAREQCIHFDPTSHENKLIYTSIFTEYTTRVETLMSDALEASGLGVSLEDVELLVEAQPERLQGDVFDVLMSMGDFEEFKSLMLSYREQVEYEERQAAREKAIAEEKAREAAKEKEAASITTTTEAAPKASASTSGKGKSRASSDVETGFAGMAITGKALGR